MLRNIRGVLVGFSSLIPFLESNVTLVLKLEKYRRLSNRVPRKLFSTLPRKLPI